ncbi:MAG: hypothetical protein V2J14_02120, partial [Erythrobacter sp.]|nr:hypothetical protein [Erythrobacter sp.]
ARQHQQPEVEQAQQQHRVRDVMLEQADHGWLVGARLRLEEGSLPSTTESLSVGKLYTGP